MLIGLYCYFCQGKHHAGENVYYDLRLWLCFSIAKRSEQGRSDITYLLRDAGV